MQRWIAGSLVSGEHWRISMNCGKLFMCQDEMAGMRARSEEPRTIATCARNAHIPPISGMGKAMPVKRSGAFASPDRLTSSRRHVEPTTSDDAEDWQKSSFKFIVAAPDPQQLKPVNLRVSSASNWDCCSAIWLMHKVSINLA